MLIDIECQWTNNIKLDSVCVEVLINNYCLPCRRGFDLAQFLCHA